MVAESEPLHDTSWFVNHYNSCMFIKYFPHMPMIPLLISSNRSHYPFLDHETPYDT